MPGKSWLQRSTSPHQGCAPLLSAVAPGGQTPWHRIHRHRRVGASQQIPIEGRDRRQAPHDGRRRQPSSRVREVHDVLSAGPRLLLFGHEGHHVCRRHLDWVFGDDGEERLQIVRIGAHRVRPGPSGSELQEGVDQLMTELISIAATLTGDALQLRRPDHGNPPLSEPPPGEILPGRSAELADHPYKWITRISAVAGHPPGDRRHRYMDMGYSVSWSQTGGSGYP
jgi:hypothetical protein